MMTLTVFGEAVPQGSKSARVVRNAAGKNVAVLTDGFGKKPRQLRNWRKAIAQEASLWMQQNNRPPLTGPVVLHVTFYVRRPKSTPKRVLYPATRPDLDKLVRGVADALTKVVYEEDSRIVSILAKKRFAKDTEPCAVIIVSPAPCSSESWD